MAALIVGLLRKSSSATKQQVWIFNNGAQKGRIHDDEHQSAELVVGVMDWCQPGMSVIVYK